MRPGHERTRGLGGGAGSWGVAQVVSEWADSATLRTFAACFPPDALAAAGALAALVLARLARVLGVQQ